MKKLLLAIAIIVISIVTYSFTNIENNINDEGLVSARADHIAIGVVNFEENVAFYKEVMGFEEEVRWQVEGLSDLYFAYLKRGDFKIEIIGNPKSEPKNVVPNSFGEHLSQQGYVHLCFEVDDLDQTFKELNAKGIKTFVPHDSYPLNTTHRRSVGFIKDPSGNVIEFANELKKENNEQ